MLVLSRKVGEKLVIGDGIVITVNRIVGHRVSIGVEAPPRCGSCGASCNRTLTNTPAPAPLQSS